MAAVVRLKRHLDEEPLDILLLNCKKRKTEGEVEEENSTFLTFAGTLNNENDDIHKHLQNHTKTSLEETYKKHNPHNIRDKIRENTELVSKNDRFKVVTLFRTKNEDESLTIVDIESQSSQDKKDFVYDIYYTKSDGFGAIDEQELISVYPLNDDLVFGSPADNGVNESDTESDDSNDENNYKNDYPDEDDSINEDDMVKAMNDLELHDNSLSSDAELEGFIYSTVCDADESEVDDDVNEVDHYGERYARFKSKYRNVGKEDDSNDDESDGYKCSDSEED